MVSKFLTGSNDQCLQLLHPVNVKVCKQTAMYENPESISTPDDMSPMVNILARLTKEGYTTQFKASENTIISTRTQQSYRPSDVQINHFYRFEGVSDPDDMSIVYAIV